MYKRQKCVTLSITCFQGSGTYFVMNLMMNLRRVSCSCLDVDDGLYEEPFVRGTVANLTDV